MKKEKEKKETDGKQRQHAHDKSVNKYNLHQTNLTLSLSHTRT